MNSTNILEKIISLCKRRGVIFLSSQIYGGLESIYDYGPIGVLIKNNIKKLWWEKYVEKREDIIGLDTSILMHKKVWEASGHLENFNDLMIECKKCKKRFRADKLLEELEIKFKDEKTYLKKIFKKINCPECKGEFGNLGYFNTMFKTFFGPYEKSENVIYLRPETAQGIFVNFKNIINSYRIKLPFGVAQIGKSFRNEITTEKFLFRTREFEQMEIEWFCQPKKYSPKNKDPLYWYEYWKKERYNWYIKDLGIKKQNLKLKKIKKEELAHYAKKASDIEFLFSFGWQEIEGIAYRTDFDLKIHSNYSKEDLKYFDEKFKVAYYPHVIEPSAGVDRIFLALLFNSYKEENIKGRKRILLSLKKNVAPFKLAVFPLLSNNEHLVKKSKEIYEYIKEMINPVLYDEVGSIGKRYRRIDEIGVPFAITIDHRTLKDNTITIRDRDTMHQIRVKIKEIPSFLKENFNI